MSELPKIATRNAFGEALKELGADERLVVLDADLGKSTMTCFFGEAYPERYINVGIAEGNMAGVAAGLAASGKAAVLSSFAVFAPGRMVDQIRNSIAYPGLNVKIVGSHAGVTVGEDGATHQALEDVALMRALPGMTVLSPCDAHETKLAVAAMLAHTGPCYMRTGRLAVAQITNTLPGYKFELGKGAPLADGGDVAIVATGFMVAQAMAARELLAAEGIAARVIDMHTIKPLDTDILVQAAKDCGCIVTAEEHSVVGGLGGAVAEALGELCPVPVIRVGVRDVFGKSGKPGELVKLFGLTPEDIAAAARRAMAMK